MNAGLFETLGKSAGLAGLCVGLVLVIFRTLLKLNVFPKLNVPEAYQLLRLLIILTFAIGVVGIVAWTITTIVNRTPQAKEQAQPHAVMGHVVNRQTNSTMNHV